MGAKKRKKQKIECVETVGFTSGNLSITKEHIKPKEYVDRDFNFKEDINDKEFKEFKEIVEEDNNMSDEYHPIFEEKETRVVSKNYGAKFLKFFALLFISIFIFAFAINSIGGIILAIVVLAFIRPILGSEDK